MASITVLNNFSPRVIIIDSPATEITIQELYDAVRAWEDQNPNMDDESLIDAAGKEPLGGGVTVGITATLNNAQIRFEARTTPLDTGTATSTDATGKTLTDNTAQFVTDGIIYVGCTLYNGTTGDMETVLDFTETTITTQSISGAGGSGWTSGDLYYIYPNVQCNISGGNLVAVDDVGAELTPVLQSPNVQVVRTSSSSATLSDLEAIQYSSYAGGVSVDVNATHAYSASTLYPAGNQEYPVNNIPDAISIASTRGLNTVFIRGDITLTSADDVSGYVLIGQNPIISKITVQAGANVLGTEFKEAEVTGDIDGNNIFRSCRVHDITSYSGFFYECFMEPGTITLTGNTTMMKCWSGTSSSATPPIIDMGGTGNSFIGRQVSGPFKITNKTGADDVCLDFVSGRLEIDSTVTNGTIRVAGSVEIDDNSTGATVVGSRGVSTTGHIDRAVFIDTDLTDAGEGTQRRPFNSVATALDYAEAEGITRLMVHSDMTVDRQLKNFVITGVGTPIIDCNSQNLDKCEFKHCHMRGIYTGTITVQESILGQNFVLNGYFEKCAIVDDLTCVNGGDVLLAGVFSMIPGTARPTISMNGTGSSTVSIRNYSGGLLITDCNNVLDIITVEMSQGRLKLDSTCTAGEISCRGIAYFEDESNGSTVDITGLFDPSKNLTTNKFLGLK